MSSDNIAYELNQTHLDEQQQQAEPIRQKSSEQLAAEPPSKQQGGARLMDKQWEMVQKKTFTKWVNTQLQKAKKEPVKEMAEEFSDGVKLLQLLEVIGDESLGKYYLKPKIRVQKCENMNRALEFIKTRGVSLTNIGAEDLVDKNEKLVLGMIWTIILRFTIAEISEEGLNAKEGLLLWCQRKTAGYKNVNVKDFTFSWQDGLAFCALIHRHRPDLLDFDKLNKTNRRENCQLAFDIAEKHLQIPKLLDVEDLVDITKPDERSVMTYVAQYFHAFAKLNSVEVAGRRVGKFAGVLKNAWDMQQDYEQRVERMKRSIQDISNEWSSASFDGSYADAKKQSNNFINYKNSEKRQWIQEKRDLDALLSNITTKRKTYNLAPYHPPQGCQPQDLDNAWSSLINAESQRRKVINEKIQAIKESLRVKYSDLANQFEHDLNALSMSLGALDGDLQAQLESVHELSNRLNGLENSLEAVKDADKQCEEAGIDDSEREYTVYSVQDIEFDFGVVKAALKKKTAFIENQIVARKQTNLTPQQLEEFESTFKNFDKNNSNTLNKIEFKACLQSLGKAFDDDKQLDEVYYKWSEGKEELPFEKFTAFMVSVTEDRTTPEQLLESFNQISKGKDHITEMDMRAGQVPPEMIEYLKSVLPPKEGVEGGYDFQAYLSSVFQQ